MRAFSVYSERLSDVAKEYRNWKITAEFIGYSAIGPDYDAWTEGEGKWSDNGQVVYAMTLEGVKAEVDDKIEELQDE